jgi:energy-coupling factor transporter ATP-binding protein EcfA2
MGLAPQIVEEVFDIVKDLNTKEKVTFLLAEQNTNMALRYSDYGYIMESGRIVMDGAGQGAAPATRTSRSSTWAWAAASARASRTSRATSAASAGWPDGPPPQRCGAPPQGGGTARQSRSAAAAPSA